MFRFLRRIFVMYAGRVTTLAALCALSCSPSPSGTDTYRIVYGGDVFFGRGLNTAMLDETKRDSIFGNLKPLFERADLALVNGEGVIAEGGTFFDKGEPRPFTFRVGPNMLKALVGAGIDVITVANNHACDYGPLALKEMLQRIRKSGMDYTGGGTGFADARTPSYHRMGDLVLAVIGVDLTGNTACAAKGIAPGILTFASAGSSSAVETIAEDLLGLLHNAKKHANLVFLTPHWGENGKDAPDETTRRLADILIRGGYDGIFGHSAHRFQGVELIEGKPVIYDAGNLVDDMGGAPSFLWEIEFNRAGVKRLIGRPLALKPNRTDLMPEKTASRSVSRLRAQSRPFKTPVFESDGAAIVYCRPKTSSSANLSETTPPARPASKGIIAAPDFTLRDKLPDDATPAAVVFENGITLEGYKLLADELFHPKAAQVIELFFKCDKPQARSLEIQLEAVSKKNGINLDRHLPGDWLLPGDMWPVGKIVTDRKLFRLNFPPKGTVAFYFTLFDKTPVLPISSSLPLRDGSTIYLGEAAFRQGAPRIFHYLHQTDLLRKSIQR